MVSDRCEPSPSVRWLGFPSDEELAGLYRRAWVFCLPSTYEGFGIPYIEAMANGTPVVATPNPGSRMVLAEGRHGLVVGEDELASTLVRLLTDEEERDRWAAAGRRRAWDFSWPRVVDAHESAYRHALDQSRR